MNKMINKQVFSVKKISCKKAATPSQILIDFWATLIIVLILATFFFILYLSQDKREIAIAAKAAEFEVNDELLFILQSPVIMNSKITTDSKIISFSEAVAISVQENDFTQLEEMFLSVASSLQSEGCADISIEYLDIKKIIPAALNCEEYSRYEHNDKKIYKTKIKIPSLDGKSINDKSISITYSISKTIPEYRYRNE